MSNKTFSSENGRTQGDFGGTAFMVQATEQFCKGKKFLYKEENFLAEPFSAALLLYSGQAGVYWLHQHLF